MRVLPLQAASAATAFLLSFALAAAAEPSREPADAPPVAAAGEAKAAVPETAPAPASATSAPAAPERPKPPTLVARINLTTQRLDLHVGGRLAESWPISSGRAGYPTPRGVFRPQWASRMWYSRKYDNAPMPHAVFFNGGIAIHATQSTAVLGQPASHGCVRLAPAPAARFYRLAHSHGFHNTRIEVFGTPPAPRLVRRSAPAPMRAAGFSPGSNVSGGWVGWSPPAASPPWATAPQVTLRRSANRPVRLPPGSPFQGRASFVVNGITYVRVR